MENIAAALIFIVVKKLKKSPVLIPTMCHRTPANIIWEKHKKTENKKTNGLIVIVTDTILVISVNAKSVAKIAALIKIFIKIIDLLGAW